MKVASKISPCPITEVLMEVRFDTKIDEGAVFGVLYNLIKNEFDKAINLPILELPSSIRKTDKNLIYLPYYRIESKSNKNKLIQIGPKVFSIVLTNGDYPGWKNFYNDILYGLEKLKQSEIVSKIVRFSLRYINFFSEDITAKTNISILLNNTPLKTRNSVMRFEIPDGEFVNILTIGSNAIKTDASGITSGSTIDIDTVFEGEVPNFFHQMDILINKCHDKEKILFFSLLSEDYSNSLKEISYD